MNKAELRQLISERQRLFTADQQKAADRLIQAQALTLIKPYQAVGIYQSLPHEAATGQIMQELLARGCRLSSGKCLPDNQLEFRLITDPRELISGTRQILEPTGAVQAKQTIEAILIPLVAFDAQHHRLGHGQGYYDRFLADYPGLKIGLAYAYQEVDRIAVTAQDIPLDLIITERGIN